MDDEALDAALVRLVEELNGLERYYVALEQQTHSNSAAEEFKCRVFDTTLVHVNELLKGNDSRVKHKTFLALKASVFLEQKLAVAYLVTYYNGCKDKGTLHHEDCGPLMDDVAMLRATLAKDTQDRSEFGLLLFVDGQEFRTDDHLFLLLHKIGERLVQEGQILAEPLTPDAPEPEATKNPRRYLDFLTYSHWTLVSVFLGVVGSVYAGLWAFELLVSGLHLFLGAMGAGVLATGLFAALHPGKIFRNVVWACLGTPFITTVIVIVLTIVRPEWAEIVKSSIPEPAWFSMAICAPLALIIEGVLTYFRERD